MSAERVVSLGAIKYVGLSSLRDDWVAFCLGSNTEPDLFFSCVFKTELVTRLMVLLRGHDLRIGPTYTSSCDSNSGLTMPRNRVN
jgi:myosin-1